MKHRTSIWLRILPALLLLCFSVVAQQGQDAAAKQELVLRVTSGDDRPWEIPAFDGGGGEKSVFRRLESWKPSDKESPVTGIVFKIGREDDIVIAHLSLRLENEKELIVGTYRLSEGEVIKTEELTKFGLVPLWLKVVKAKPPFKDPVPPITPRLENKTKAIEVVSFIQSQPPLDDSFQLSLRNASNKIIVGLDLYIPSADGNGGQGERSVGGDRNHPLMLPGAVSVRHIGISRGGRMTADGYVPDVAVQQTLIIRTVVFADGTYDGLIEPAAEMEAERRGLDIQRRRILRLLQDPENTSDRDSLTTLRELKERAYALDKAADASITQEVIALFPSLDEKAKDWLSHRIEAGLRGGKMELLHRIKDFEETQKQPGEHLSFVEWIKQTKADYEKLTTDL